MRKGRPAIYKHHLWKHLTDSVLSNIRKDIDASSHLVTWNMQYQGFRRSNSKRIRAPPMYSQNHPQKLNIGNMERRACRPLKHLIMIISLLRYEGFIFVNVCLAYVCIAIRSTWSVEIHTAARTLIWVPRKICCSSVLMYLETSSPWNRATSQRG